MLNKDEHWMRLAMEMAENAKYAAEVPVGAVLVMDNKLVSRGWNKPISTCDPTAHAEIIALREAAQQLKNYRLPNTTLYVTLEPCLMCAGALIHARIQRLVFATADPKTGAICSHARTLESKSLNHRIDWQMGVLAKECEKQLKDFFITRRIEQKT